ncbi:MAG: NADH:flavin oxidoreductase [Deltaproteobacteria bacterium]|nr:NADH:flavin oxidoreductase [Deltaproteobacteria bacterium]
MPEHDLHPSLSAYRLGELALRNRVIKTATFEGMTPGGVPGEDLIEHHREIAAGGAAMTTVAYCSASRDGLTFEHQMVAGEALVPGLRRLTDAVHAEGAAAALQIGHAGYFASPSAAGSRPIGASRVFNLYTLTWPRIATRADLDRIESDFARATVFARECGFDALEVHLGHGYLLSQFLSPYTNRRKDAWGGDLEGRLRFPLSVLRRVRDAAGKDLAVMAKCNLRDGFTRGLDLSEATEIIRRIQSEGVADAVVLSGGFVSKTPFYMMRGELPVAEMVRNERQALRRIGLRLFGRLFVQEYAFEETFFLKDALEVRAAVSSLPLVLLGGIRRLEQMDRAVCEHGFDFVSMGRPLIMEPDLIRRMQRGEATCSRCEPCNKCVGEMENSGIRCTHPELGRLSTSRFARSD